MDFKSLISKIESIDGPIDTPKAPEQAAPIRLDEDTELRVLAGVTALTESVIAEKAVSKKQQKFMGMVHAAQKGEKPASKEVAKVAKTMKKKDAEDYASTKHKGLPEKKKAKKESIDPTEFREKFAKLVEAKKAKKDYDGDGKVESGKDEYMGAKDKAIKKAMGKKVDEAAKPDFLDMDKDGNKKEPMKKAVKDKKVKEDASTLKKVGDTAKTHKGGTVTKTATGIKHERDPSSYSDEDGDEKSGKGKKSHAKSMSAAEKKERAPKQKQSKSGTWGMKDGEKFDNRKKNESVNEVSKETAISAAKKRDAQKSDDMSAATKRKDVMVHLNNRVKLQNYKEGKVDSKKVVAESVEQALSLKDMLRLVQESGGQQAIDPMDQALWTWANRVAANKIQESQKAEIFAAMIYERNGGRFEMYDVLSEDQK